MATNNFDKVREMKRILKGLKIKILTLKDFPPIPEVAENGRTFRANAVKKAAAISRKTGGISLADDSGLEVEALRGKPGVRSSRFAGEDCTYVDNNRKLLRLMKNIQAGKRKARFVCVIALAKPKGVVKTITGICKGRISAEIKGTEGVGYDPVFIPSGYTRTFAELGMKTKNRISHRAKALRKAKKVFSKLF